METYPLHNTPRVQIQHFIWHLFAYFGFFFFFYNKTYFTDFTLKEHIFFFFQTASNNFV